MKPLSDISCPSALGSDTQPSLCLLQKIYIFCPYFVGNKHLLRCDNDPETGFWGKLLQFYKDHGCIVNANLFPFKRGELHQKQVMQGRAMDEAVYLHRVHELHDDKFRQLAPRFQKQVTMGEQTHMRHYNDSESDSD